MAIGSVLDVINAKRVELILDPDGTNQSFVTLQEISLPIERPETREEVELGSVYFYGQHDNSFDATMLLTAADVGTYLSFNKLVNGALQEGVFDIRLTGKDDVIATIRVTAVTPRQNIEKLPRGGVKIYQRFRITQDVDESDVTIT